jgi:restriction endonuclease Mrr
MAGAGVCTIRAVLPRQIEVELPLLRVLAEAGGSAHRKDIVPALTTCFPGITEDDLALRMSDGQSRWKNRIQWARQKLVGKGELTCPSRGVWQITAEGRARLERRSV